MNNGFLPGGDAGNSDRSGTKTSDNQGDTIAIAQNTIGIADVQLDSETEVVRLPSVSASQINFGGGLFEYPLIERDGEMLGPEEQQENSIYHFYVADADSMLSNFSLENPANVNGSIFVNESGEGFIADQPIEDFVSGNANTFATSDVVIIGLPFQTGDGVSFETELSPSNDLSEIVRVADLDQDNDGVPNNYDIDIDGDGINNDIDEDDDNDGIADGTDVDRDGDGVVDVGEDGDGDGFPDTTDDVFACDDTSPCIDTDNDQIVDSADALDNRVSPPVPVQDFGFDRDDINSDGISDSVSFQLLNNFFVSDGEIQNPTNSSNLLEDADQTLFATTPFGVATNLDPSSLDLSQESTLRFTPVTLRFMESGFGFTTFEFSENTITGLTRQPDNFLYLEIQSDNPGSTANFVFAAGDIGATPVVTDNIEVHEFNLTAGLSGYSDLTSLPSLGMVRSAAIGNAVTYGNSSLLTINPQDRDSTTQKHRMFQSTFGISGAQVEQQSVLAVSLGELSYSSSDCSAAGDGDNRVCANADGSTVGSVRVNQVNPDETVIVAGEKEELIITSNFTSTAFGGGATGTGSVSAGRVSYLLLENAVPDPTSPDILTSGFEGGIESTLSGGSQRYSLTRLATRTRHTGFVEDSARAALSIKGWVGGFFSQLDTNGNTRLGLIDDGTTVDDTGDMDGSNTILEVTLEPVSNTVTSTIELPGRSIISLGGANGDSAFFDNDRFAAGNAEVVLVTGEALLDPIGSGNVKAPAEIRQHLIETDPDTGDSVVSYDHVKWGFFLGDINSDETVTNHVHAGVWVAGDATQASELQAREGNGSAVYSGHMVGNVVSNGSQYIATGNYKNTWTFADPSGAGNTGDLVLKFDQIDYTGTSQLREGTAEFSGTFTQVDGTGTRAGALNGAFYGDDATNQAGNFFINGGSSYAASGIFAAEEKAAPAEKKSSEGSGK